MNRLRDAWYRFENAAVQALLWALAKTPPALLSALGGTLASAIFWLSPGRRRVAIANIEAAGIARDRSHARRLAASAFRTFVLMVIEAAAARRRLTRETFSRHVRVDVPPDVRALLDDPDAGVIVASAHIGNWEVVARAVALIKPLTAIYRPFKNPYLDRSLQQSRSGEDLRLVAKYEDDPMRFVRSLSQGEILAIMIDQHTTGNPVIVEFFGRQAATTPSVAMLHLVTKAPLVVAYALRTGPLAYEVRATGPFAFRRSGDRERDVHTVTQALTDEIERIARAHPEQYMWGHRRWKHDEKRRAREAAAGATAEGAQPAPNGKRA